MVPLLCRALKMEQVDEFEVISLIFLSTSFFSYSAWDWSSFTAGTADFQTP